MGTCVHEAVGRVVDGRIEVECERLEEGRRVSLFIVDDQGVNVTPEAKRFLLEQHAAVERGETVDALEFLDELRRDSFETTT